MLIDNKSNGRVGDELQAVMKLDSKLSILSALFSLYGFSELQESLGKIDSVRLLLPSEDAKAVGVIGSENDRRFRNKLNLSSVAKDCASWIHKKAEVRSLRSPIGQNLFHIQNGVEDSIAIHGSSPFTTDGLGFNPTSGFAINTLFSSANETRSLLNWFNSIWNNQDEVNDIKKQFLSDLESLYSDNSVNLLYFFVLYNIFTEFIEELDEENIIKTKTGIKDTIVWNKLYKFQSDGVLGAIDKIEKYNGCIIADSVGLGKTFEALAVIKYYELRNDRVLVLCPKKLRDNWTLYTVNDKRNIFASDRFNYDVLNHTDLSRISGLSGEINLATLNWGNYDLVVIDESHNFRNNPPKKGSVTRYSRLMSDIVRAGVKTKVLMLSATPVNNRMTDLKNQVAFITEGDDMALKEHGINSVEESLRRAQTRFNQWQKLDEENRTTEALLETLNFDYFRLLDLLTIARSRRHIEKYYDISEIGRFPERVKPINIKAEIDTKGLFPPLEDVNRSIRKLNLSAYSPLKYVLSEKREEYSRKYDMQLSGGSVFKQIDREASLIHLMRVNLFKRMESSINSFGMTLGKLLNHVQDIIRRIDQHDPAGIEELSIEDIEVDSIEFDTYLIGNKVKVLIQDIDRIRWKQELEEDKDLLKQLLEETGHVDPEDDAKLLELKKAISNKVISPINPGNLKVIVFTAFADTANYLYSHLSDWAMDKHGIHSALVSGGSGGNKTTMPGIRKDLSSILTSFSPVSKERSKVDENLSDEIDLLIATDCISEGQNLQDCDYLVNYDIHWNPVRIIQRFGRVDRLGSRNEAIQLVNFWPNLELDEYINLEARVSGRMVLLDISATGEENIIEQNSTGQMNDLEYRRRQLERLQKEVVDIEDLGDNISITDLTLNDFRMDLTGYLKEHLAELEAKTIGTFAVIRADEELKPGVIFCLRSENPKVVTDKTYALSPHYLVYVSENSEVILNYTQAKKALDFLRKGAEKGKDLDLEAMKLFNRLTKKGRNMSAYQDLLGKAVATITGKAEEHGTASLFSRGGTAISKDTFKGIDDFEVVAYLIILDTEESV
ncbi:helicase-related protein [Maridesulfovibrio ferrireducens]|uniref:helicase-related protein n=1 Tax=Maridesulfovibrio ferrireducens TaxID=246191 RepID=UPI001A278779|nr:helicase-related protein [Maridesulfovibrio ferrireducens]MBI9112742.1 DEAD/DEAH box helicase family protein [Maridesulfovibrio ferrireducens]